jgi:hypothetical protein
MSKGVWCQLGRLPWHARRCPTYLLHDIIPLLASNADFGSLVHEAGGNHDAVQLARHAEGGLSERCRHDVCDSDVRICVVSKCGLLPSCLPTEPRKIDIRILVDSRLQGIKHEDLDELELVHLLGQSDHLVLLVQPSMQSLSICSTDGRQQEYNYCKLHPFRSTTDYHLSIFTNADQTVSL